MLSDRLILALDRGLLTLPDAGRIASEEPGFAKFEVTSAVTSGELVSPVSAPQPARKKLNSSLPAREKNTVDGIASSLVSMPARVSMPASQSTSSGFAG